MLKNDKKPSLDTLALIHYGVRGMRWGTRRSGAQNSSRTRPGKKSKPVRTEQEIAEREKRRAEISAKRKAAGKKAVRSALKGVGDLATTAIKIEAQAAMQREIRRAMRATMHPEVK